MKLACSEIKRLFNAWKHSFWNRHPFTTWCIGRLVPVPSDWYWLKAFFQLPPKSSRGCDARSLGNAKLRPCPLTDIDWRLSFGFHVEGKEVLWCTKPWWYSLLWQGSPAPIIVALRASYLMRAPGNRTTDLWSQPRQRPQPPQPPQPRHPSHPSHAPPALAQPPNPSTPSFIPSRT